MIPVSNAYKEIVKSRIRPKITPEIKISGVDTQGNEINLVWTSQNIKDLNYKRGIDPLGRQLPFMELTWTEIYTGDLNEENYPNKYNNIAKYMKVELSFYQDLSFFNSWKTLFNSGKTWKELYNSATTWKSLKNNVSKEKITFPDLFLVAKPTYKNKTINWKAVDLLSFLVEKQTLDISGDAPIINPTRLLLLNERGNFFNNKDIFDALTNSDDVIKQQFSEVSTTLEKALILDGQTKNLLSQYVQLHYWYLDFSKKGIKIVNTAPQDNGDVFYLNTMIGNPEIELNSPVSTYSFKSYSRVENEEKSYTKNAVDGELININGVSVYKINYDGYGYIVSDKNNRSTSGFTFGVAQDADDVLTIAPIEWVSTDNTITSNNDGETYTENIPCFIYDSTHKKAKERFGIIVDYFKKSSSVKFKSLSNLSVEVGDVITVETNLRDNSGNAIKKKGQVVQMELNYNGALKQSFIVHTDSRWE